MNLDTAISELMDHFRKNGALDRVRVEELKAVVQSGDFLSQRMNQLQIVKRIGSVSKNCSELSILDYGCGTGILVTILQLMGYRLTKGCDVIEKFDSDFSNSLGFTDVYRLVGARTYYEDNSFDIVLSVRVVEHVRDLATYYDEAARVLRPGGRLVVCFPHRLQVYDSHSRTYLIHWFPKFIRLFLWDVFSRQGGEYLDSYLYLRTVSYHKKIAMRYFQKVSDLTSDRIINMSTAHYKGNIIMRKFGHRLMRLPVIGYAFVSLFSVVAARDLVFVK